MTDLDLSVVEVDDKQLSALAGVSARRIRQLAEAGTLTRVARNRFILGDAFRALVEEMAGGEKASDLTAERVRKVRADADLAELELARQKRLVAPIAEFESVWKQFCGVLRANLRQIPSRVAPSIVAETDERRLKTVLLDEIDLALTAAADYAANPDNFDHNSEEDPDDGHEPPSN